MVRSRCHSMEFIMPHPQCPVVRFNTSVHAGSLDLLTPKLNQFIFLPRPYCQKMHY